MGTIGKLAEITRDSYYKNKSPQDANYSLRYFAEKVAMKWAKFAVADAYQNSNAGESTYANNQFITTFKGIDIEVATDGEKYSDLPATPAGLPNGQEIVKVRIVGNKCMDCVPMKTQMAFSQDLIGLPKGMVLFKVEGTKIVYVSSNPFIEGKVDISMVAGVPNNDIFNFNLNAPKNVEDSIMMDILKDLLPWKQVPVDNVNDNVSQ